MKSNAELCISTDIFLDSIQTVVVRILAELRPLNAFAEELALLLMDNCSNHITSDIIRLLTKTPMHRRIFALHTT
jgi:hypothetical protein